MVYCGENILISCDIFKVCCSFFACVIKKANEIAIDMVRLDCENCTYIYLYCKAILISGSRNDSILVLHLGHEAKDLNFISFEGF